MVWLLSFPTLPHPHLSETLPCSQAAACFHAICPLFRFIFILFPPTFCIPKPQNCLRGESVGTYVPYSIQPLFLFDRRKNQPAAAARATTAPAHSAMLPELDETGGEASAVSGCTPAAEGAACVSGFLADPIRLASSGSGRAVWPLAPEWLTFVSTAGSPAGIEIVTP